MEELKPICPTCGGELKKIPQKKTKCPHCSAFIYLKYSPSNRNKRLVNDEENEKIEQEWQAHYSMQKIKDKLSFYGIELSNSEIESLKNKTESEIYVELTNRFIEKSVEFKNLFSLYFEIAKDLYPKTIGKEQAFVELTEEEQDDLSETEYNSYFPVGNNYDNFWEAFLAYISYLQTEIKRLNQYKKAGLEKYKISVVVDHNTSQFDINYNNKSFTVTEAIDSIKLLLSSKTKEELIKYRPLLLFGDNSTTKFLFPPFRLGCRARTVTI